MNLLIFKGNLNPKKQEIINIESEEVSSLLWLSSTFI